MRKCQLCGNYAVRSELRLSDTYACGECCARYRVPALYEWLTLLVVAFFPLLGIYLGIKFESWSVFLLFVFVLPFFVQKAVGRLVTLQLVDESRMLDDGGAE